MGLVVAHRVVRGTGSLASRRSVCCGDDVILKPRTHISLSACASLMGKIASRLTSPGRHGCSGRGRRAVWPRLRVKWLGAWRLGWVRGAACPGWWPWGLLCWERWSYYTHLPEESPALGELDVDAGSVAGTWACVVVLPGLGGGQGRVFTESLQTASFARCSGKADGVLFLGHLSVPSSLLGSSEKQKILDEWMDRWVSPTP